MTVLIGFLVIFLSSAATISAVSMLVNVSTRIQASSPSIRVQLTTEYPNAKWICPLTYGSLASLHPDDGRVPDVPRGGSYS